MDKVQTKVIQDEAVFITRANKGLEEKNMIEPNIIITVFNICIAAVDGVLQSLEIAKDKLKCKTGGFG